MNHLVSLPNLYLKLQTNTTSPPTLASVSLCLNCSEKRDSWSPSLKTPTVKPTKQDETNAETLLLGCFHHCYTQPTTSADRTWKQPCMCKTSVKTKTPDRVRAEAQPIICWMAGLPGICYVREWTAPGAGELQLAPPNSYKLVPPFTLLEPRNSKSLVRCKRPGMCHSDPLGGEKSCD